MWPEVNVAGWAQTKRTFHLYLQMLGKMRVTLSPVQPNWMFTALYLSARGVTNRTDAVARHRVEASLDVFSSELLIQRSIGDSRRIALLPARTVAAIDTELQAKLEELDVECAISTIPQEVPDTLAYPTIAALRSTNRTRWCAGFNQP